jgi:hypothetical protein
MDFLCASRRPWLSLLAVVLLTSCDRPTEESKTPQHLPDGTTAIVAADSTIRPAPAAFDSTHLLAPGRAGMVRVGMNVGAVRALFGPALREVTLQRGGEDFPAYAVGKVKDTGLPALLLEPLCEEGEDTPKGAPTDHCRIWRITIRDPGYRTISGLGVGSRYGDLRAGAPLSFVGPNPMGIAATVESWQMNFLLDGAAIEARHLPARRETIHDTVRITGIQLYR